MMSELKGENKIIQFVGYKPDQTFNPNQIFLPSKILFV